jgi:endoglucanase
MSARIIEEFIVKTTRYRSLTLGLVLSFGLIVAACSSGSGSGGSGSGGSTSSGGSGSGGSGASGGSIGSGGLGSGGSGSGGRTGSGGSGSGGSSASGGRTGSDGLGSGGSSASGGNTGSGGSGSGGRSASGGNTGLGSGGSSASGGSTGSGGSAAGGAATGGAATGGSTSTGGSPATAAQLVATWTLGWNLGNSLDSDGCGASAETCWGNPLITQDLLTQVAAHGFKVVRIPVTWSEHLGAAPNYTIDATWLARVDTVVNYALTAGLDVIINVHHDGADAVDKIQWLGIEMYGTTMMNEFESLWTQIANHFKDYDNRLLFEAMNEIHEGYGTAQASWYTDVNNLDQDFVTTVRKTGGNNANRFLVVPGYNTSIDDTLAGFVLPTDTITKHLIVTYHYYTPYEFAINAATLCWGAAYSCSNNYGQESFVTSEFDKMKTKYIDSGTPVIMAEYNAAATLSTNGAEKYRRYWIEYVTKAAHDRGIAPLLWDAGQELFNRTTTPASIRYQDVMDCLTRAATSSYTLAQVAAP